jgi:NADPH:quinone reductase
MKAVQISQYGDVGVLNVTQEAPRPTVGGGKVLVEVHAASVNPIDTTVRSGFYAKMMPLTSPATVGTDFAGVSSLWRKQETLSWREKAERSGGKSS